MDQKRCIYCGKITEKTKYAMKIGKDNEDTVYCCSISCYQDMKRYIEENTVKKNIFYVAAGIMVLANLVILGYHLSFRWMYLPMIGLGIAVALCPSLYVTNYFYRKFGIVKTIKLIRMFGIAFSLMGVLFTLTWK